MSQTQPKTLDVAINLPSMRESSWQRESKCMARSSKRHREEANVSLGGSGYNVPVNLGLEAASDGRLSHVERIDKMKDSVLRIGCIRSCTWSAWRRLFHGAADFTWQSSQT